MSAPAPSPTIDRESLSRASAVPQTRGEQMLAELTGNAPETFPEVLCFVTMAVGAIDAVHRQVGELEERLAHVLRDPEPSPPLDTHYPVQPTTALAQRTCSLYDQVAAAEHRLVSIRHRLAV